MENKGNETISFIQLVKSILEYYGTTKKIKKQDILTDFSNELEEAESLISNFDKQLGVFEEFDMNSMFVEVPEDVDSEIKKTFIYQLKSYQ